MVLRKPYAFLIKHFRLIHLVITAIFGYVVIKNREIYRFIKSVIANVGNKYDAHLYMKYSVFIFIFIAIILCLMVYYLLKYKDKPRKIYMVTIVGYVIIVIYMLVLFGYMGGFNNNAIEQKTIRLYKDLLTISLWFQYYIVLVMGIRGLGFDIKRFDFRRDVQEINMEAADGEEIEINTQLDTTNAVRWARKQRREFGYFLREYKLYVIVIVVIILGIVGYSSYNYFTKKYKVYSENEYVGNVYNIKVLDSYYKVDGSNNYVIISFNAYKYGKRDRLNISNAVLMIGKKKYTPDKNICYKFNVLGNCYKKQYIGSEEGNYILSYTVDKLDISKAYLVYSESYGEEYKIRLTMKEY